MAKNYIISSVGFGWLGQAFQGKNCISPFTLFSDKASGFDDIEKQLLIEQKLIDPEGTITPEVLPALQLLENADGYTRIRILGTTAPVDKIIYYKDGVNCAVDSNEVDFTVTFPAPSKEAAYVFEEFTGTSRLINTSFSIQLPKLEALLFLSLVDLTRANSLCSLGGKPGTNSFTLQEILTKAKDSSSYLDIVKSLKNLTGEMKPSDEEVLSAIDYLVQLKLVSKYAEGYSLYLSAVELASSMLIPYYVFHITSARVTAKGEIEQSQCYIVYCGMHDLLYIDLDSKGVTLETMSGSDLFGILYGALTAPILE